jgi:hypothetical protein
MNFMKTEELLRYERMYQAMRRALQADVLAFGFDPSCEQRPVGAPGSPAHVLREPPPARPRNSPDRQIL